VVNEVGDTLLSVGYTDERVTSSSLHGGMHPITIDYQAENLVVVTDETNQVTTTYNLTFKHGIAQVESFSGPGCSSCGSDNGTLTYTDLLQVESFTDANNIKTSYGYDANGNRETVTEADGNPLQRVTTTIHDLSTNLVTSITRDSVGSCGQQAVETWVYDVNNHPDFKTESGCKGTLAITRTTEYTYDSFGRIEYFNGPRPDSEFIVGKDDITFIYYPDDAAQGNKQGMLHTVTNGLGHVTEFKEYNGLRKPTLIEDANGVQTNLSYNDFGQLTGRTTGTRTIIYEYDNAGVLQVIHLPGNRNLDYEYYTNGKVWKITDNAGNYIEYFYDALGNSAGRDIKDSGGTLTATINYVYDIKGRLHKTYDGLDSDMNKPGEELRYDNVGNLEEKKILKEYSADTYLSTMYTYDELRRLETIREPGSDHVNTIFGYDIHDNQTSVTDDNGVITSYIFDDFGRKASEKITENGVENLIANFEYDLADNLIQKIDGNSTTINYQYDALNRLLDVAYADPAQDIDYVYDEDVDTLPNKGRLTSMADSSGNSSYMYNTYNELTKETRITDGHPFITEYDYNDNGELSYIIYPSGRKITYTRTAMGQLSSIDSLYQGISGVMARNIKSNPFGPITDMTMGNGQQLTNTYDTLYRLNSAAVDSIYNRTYTYWSNGQVKTITDGIDSSNNQVFNYDDLGHLATADGTYSNLDFDHDNVGNRTNLTDATTTTLYDYFIGSNRLSQLSNGSTVNYGYDNIGNISTISQDSTVFNWSDDYRLQSVTKNTVTVGAYKYDGRGLRTAKTAGSETTIFVYDQAGNLFAEADNQGNVLKEYVYVNGEIFAHFQYNPSVPSALVTQATERLEKVESNKSFPEHKAGVSFSGVGYATSSEIASRLIPVYYLLMMKKTTGLPVAEGAYYYIDDHLAAPQIITDDTGAIAWRGIYSPFGDVNVASGNSIVNNIRFPGQYFDAETGLHYNWHRYYDPATGRYISADPIGLYGGLNLYAYVSNDPVNWVDSWGLSAMEGALPLGGGLAAADGPLPVGDIIGGGIILGAGIYDAYQAWQYWNENQNEKTPKNCPTGTKDIKKVKGKYGWSKDQLHNIKKGAHGGMGTGKSWTGVAPDGTVGINEGGEWVPQGHWEDLQ